jgi:heme exporter protein C
MKRAFAILAVLTAVLLAYGLYQALWVAPTERTMGDVQRIFYYHVPSAWTAGVLFFVNFIASIAYLVRRNSKADALAVAAAEVGVVFCTIVLVTGPIWARPVWGIWWTWDLRLTLTLVLWLIYVSYLLLRRFSTSGQTPVIAAVLAIFGTQHPQPVIGGGGSIDPRMLHAFFMNLIAFTCFGALVCWSRFRLEVQRREFEETQALESLLEPRSVS